MAEQQRLEQTHIQAVQIIKRETLKLMDTVNKPGTPVMWTIEGMLLALQTWVATESLTALRDWRESGG